MSVLGDVILEDIRSGTRIFRGKVLASGENYACWLLLSSLVLDGLLLTVIQLGCGMMCGLIQNLLLTLVGAPCDVDADAV